MLTIFLRKNVKSTIFFYESQVKYFRVKISIYKRKQCSNIFFNAVLLLFYDLKYLNSTKSRLSNQNSCMGPEVTLFPISKIKIVTKLRR